MVQGINSSNTNIINLYKKNSPQSVSGNSSPEINSLPSNVATDYNVKVPQTYTKLGVEKFVNGQEVHCYKLANGQRVMIAPMKSPKTFVNTYVNTGSMNEKDDERGISHYNEHMAFNGTFGTDGYMKLGVGDVFRKVAEMGGYTNASTGFAETNYTIGVPQFEKEDLETAIAMQAAMMNNLEMSDSMVEKEHGPVCQEINMYSDVMSEKASNLAVKNLYNIQSTSEELVAGRVDNIQNIDRKKVMDYYKNNYYPANMVTVITGDVNPDDAINLVAKHFRGENKQNPDRRFEKLTPIDKAVRRDLISEKAHSTSASIAFNGPANNDIKGQITLEAALNFLYYKSNSRLRMKLKEVGTELNPGVQKVSTVPTDGVAIGFDIDTTENNSEKALKTIFTELQNFKIKDEEELQVVKNYIKAQNQDKYENPDRLNKIIGSSSLSFNISDITNQDKIIDSLTIQDVEDVVHNYMNPQKASIVVVHPASASAETLKQNYEKANTSKVAFKGNVHKQLPLDTSKITEYKLNNNYDIAFIDTPQNTNAKSIITYTPLEPVKGKPGVEILLNRMLKEKTANKDYDQFVEYLDKYNLSQSINVDNGTIQITGDMPSKNIENFVKISQEQLMNPCFDEDILEEQKGLLKEFLEHIEPTPEEGVLKTFFPDTTQGYTVKEVLDNIDNITINDVKDYYNQIMSNSRATVSVAAPMGDRSVQNAVLPLFAQMPAAKSDAPKLHNLYKPIDKSVVITKEAPKAQAQIIQAYNFKVSGNAKDKTTFALMKSILSNGDTTGLFNNLREKEKLAYAVWADYDDSGDNAFISCNIKTTTDNPDTGERTYENVQKSINGFNRQINKMKNGEFEDKEVDVAKKELKDTLRNMSYGQRNNANTLAEGQNTPYGINHINEMYNAIDSITKEDIQKAANYVFNNKPVYSIVASKDTLAANKDYLNSLA